jgi:raffinose/stachyose/melibiose transport system permease protein
MIWQGFGWAILFFYSGLLTVPKELEEAALVDGANKFQILFHVVLPNMLPVIQSIVIIVIISSFKQMEMVFLSTEGGAGTQFLAVFLYQRGIAWSQFGYGNAISVLFVLTAVLVTLLVQRIFKKSLEHF